MKFVGEDSRRHAITAKKKGMCSLEVYSLQSSYKKTVAIVADKPLSRFSTLQAVSIEPT
jgi:hypothetical protein